MKAHTSASFAGKFSLKMTSPAPSGQNPLRMLAALTFWPGVICLVVGIVQVHNHCDDAG